MERLLKSVRNIYGSLSDEKSKFIFENRILYTLTGETEYISRIIEKSMPQKADLDKAVAFCKNHVDTTVLYGAGNDLRLLSGLYPDFEVRQICDGNRKKQKNGWHGIAVISPDELVKKKEDVYVAITTSGFYEEIMHFLLEQGFKREQIINLGLTTDVKNQYFDSEILMPQSGEVFIDGGCFNCSTDKMFINWCSGDYKKIIAFEPDKSNYLNCLEICRKEMIKNINIYNKGLWDCTTELFFEETGGQGSRIRNDIGGNRIRTSTIDETAGDEKVTFIKLDVEGAELKALQGAEKTIRRDRPRLAVSVYHKAEDIMELPAYILSLHKDYRLYLRHYQMSPCETILYAL